MKQLLILTVFIPAFCFGQAKKTLWIAAQNRLLNPGAEQNDSNLPKQWKTDYYKDTMEYESNWVSAYGVTAHEWNHGSKPLGLAANSGNNYFRLTVSNALETRKINLYQTVNLRDLKAFLIKDTVMAHFSVAVASYDYSERNCSFAEITVLFLNASGAVLDSIYLKKVPKEFNDLDANSQEAVDRGFSVMHEFQVLNKTIEVPKGTESAKVLVYCEYPCSVNLSKDLEDNNEGAMSNTFYFDNFQLGFYQK